MSIELSRRDEFGLLTLCRPEKLNALSFGILKEISAAFDEAGAWPIRALLVTGAGEKAFCAGADIEELRNRSLANQKRGAETGQATFGKLGALPFPSIALINGYAFGGGLELAMACTFRVAAQNAKMGLPEIKLGLMPGYGGTQRLPRLIGEARALELIMTGRTVPAAEALSIGVVNRVVEGEIVEAGVAFAREFSGHGMLALGFARSAVTRALDVPLNEGLKIEADLSTLAYRTQDAEEGHGRFRSQAEAGVPRCLTSKSSSPGRAAALARPSRTISADAGFDVVGLSRSGESPVGKGLRCDMTDEAALRAAISEVASWGCVVGLVNNAGAHKATPSAQLETKEIEETMRLNAIMPFVACREAFPYLKASGSGLIVNIGSFFDKLGVPGSVAYCASKAAIGAITRCLAAEWARDGVRVIDVAPGYIETDLNRDFLSREKVKTWIGARVPAGRLGQPEEVARLVGLLFAEEISFLNGETIYIDGGQGMNH